LNKIREVQKLTLKARLGEILSSSKRVEERTTELRLSEHTDIDFLEGARIEVKKNLKLLRSLQSGLKHSIENSSASDLRKFHPNFYDDSGKIMTIDKKTTGSNLGIY
jgi:hypothetical protein